MGKRILVDMDGVLADYNGRLFELNLIKPEEFIFETWRKCAISQTRKEKLKKITHSKGFYKSLKPIQDAVLSLDKLVEMGYDIYICSRPSATAFSYAEKFEWINKYFKQFTENLILTRNKSIVCGDYFIDDSLDKLLQWSFGKRILFKSNPLVKYNSIPKNVIVKNNWTEVVEYFKKLG